MEAEIKVNNLGINAISWNKSTEQGMLAVAAKDASTSIINKGVSKTL